MEQKQPAMSLEECKPLMFFKDKFAKEKGYDDWFSLIIALEYTNQQLDEWEESIAITYANQFREAQNYWKKRCELIEAIEYDLQKTTIEAQEKAIKAYRLFIDTTPLPVAP